MIPFEEKYYVKCDTDNKDVNLIGYLYPLNVIKAKR